MPEALENLHNQQLIYSVAEAIHQVYPAFGINAFTSTVFDENWQDKELKERMRHIAEMLHRQLPPNYRQAVDIIKTVAPKFSGFEYMLFQNYVELFGLDDFDTSIAALEHFTEFSSSELAVRPFIKKYETKMMAQMLLWAQSDNKHVRRLASEGCRPRLPWAMSLPAFKKNPQPVLDESEYVRRSVANNLNDISKDNPEILISILQEKLGTDKRTDRILKHASRSLLRQGHEEVLPLFGFEPPDHVSVSELNTGAAVAIGGKLSFSFKLQSEETRLSKLRIEYAIDFIKANGKPSAKRFKISEADYAGQSKSISKHYSFKMITTRKYYPGVHAFSVFVNGQQLAKCHFIVTEKADS
jgi:3-methyladenine DNA glycosylase AlkC